MVNVEYFWPILTGIKITLIIALFALMFGLILGLIGAMLERSIFPIRTLFQAWHLLIRSLPEIIIIFIFYFGLSAALSSIFDTYIEVNALISGAAALAIIFAAYAAEVINGARNAIDQGEVDAALALGMSKTQTYVSIILPNIARHAFPGLMNLWLTVLKDSAIVSVIGVVDIMRAAQSAAAQTYASITFYGFAAILYLILTGISLTIGRFIHQKLNHGAKHARIDL